MAGSCVLIVDDESTIRESVSEVLQDEGFRTESVQDGREALTWLREHHQETCLVLLDLMMPVMDGRSFLEAKNLEPELAKIPVVVVTASGRAECERILQGIVVSGCLYKPVSLITLVSTVTAACGCSGRKPAGV